MKISNTDVRLMLMCIVMGVITVMLNACQPEAAAPDARIAENAAALEGMQVADVGIVKRMAALEMDEVSSAPPPEEPSASSTHKLQVGPWLSAPFNVEEPYINIIHASAVYWANDGMTEREVYADGHINPATGLPVSLPGDSKRLYSTVFFTGADKRFYDGDWVLEWDGDADLYMQFIPADLQQRVGANRIEFIRDIARTPDHARILVTRLGDGGLAGLRLFRAENEDALNAGRIYAPGFIENVGRAHIVRTMDLQEANRAFIHRADQVAPMTQHYWGNFDFWHGNASFAAHKSMPLEAVAALGVEADVEIWHNAPITLGFPVDFIDPQLFSETHADWSENIKAVTLRNIDVILTSDEWNKYADAFVAALEASAYPETRTLYTTVSNEVWNFAPQYKMTTRYAVALSEAYGGESWPGPRYGYGVMMARWMLALESAFARAGRNQDVVYVVEGQAANPNTTRQALTGLQTYLADQGEELSDYAAMLGVSVASYWDAGRVWSVAGTENEWANPTPEMWKRLEDGILNGPGTEYASVAWVVRRFKDHAAAAGAFGVRLIGAYEGGSHLIKPRHVPRDAFLAWHWGEGGARINKSVNDALIDAFPDIILSNYATYGTTGGQPWFDGWPGDDTAMQRSWEEYHKR